MKANKRQSYDIEIEAMVEETKCKSDNFLDLKNPYFRYNGAAPQVTNKYLLRLIPLKKIFLQKAKMIKDKRMKIWPRYQLTQNFGSLWVQKLQDLFV